MRATSVAFALCLFAAGASAQHSGGRSGHSGFGGGSSGGGSSRGGGSSSSSSSRAPPTRVAPWQRSAPNVTPGAFAEPPSAAVVVSAEERAAVAVLPVRYDPPSTLAGLVVFALSFAGIGGLVLRLTRKRPQGPPGFAARPGPFPGCDLRRITLGFDGAARPTLQAALRSISARLDPANPQARHQSIREAVALLGSHLASARYACVQSSAMAVSAAAGAFDRLATELRGRYIVEAVSNQRVLGVAPGAAPRAEEGAGMLVVSVLVASTEDLMELSGQVSREALFDALQRLAPSRGEAMAGYELIWSPSEDADRMSSAELEVCYPELAKIDAGAAVGRARCGACQTVFARELGRCPQCGSPAQPGAV